MTRTNQLSRELENTTRALERIEQRVKKEEFKTLSEEGNLNFNDLDYYNENIVFFELDFNHRELSYNKDQIEAQLLLETKRSRKENWKYENPNKRSYEPTYLGSIGPIRSEDERKMELLLNSEMCSEANFALAGQRTAIVRHKSKRTSATIHISNSEFDYNNDNPSLTAKEWETKTINILRRTSCKPEETLHMIIEYALSQSEMRAERFAYNFGIKLPDTNILRSVKTSLELW